MTKVVNAVVLLAFAGVAAAQPVTSLFPGGDAGFNNLTLGGTLEQAVVESRIGNGATSGTWEVGLWRLGAVGTPLDQAGRNIASDDADGFSLSYDGATGMSFTIAGATVQTNDIGGPFTDIFIRVRSTENSSSIIDGLQFDGSPLSIAGVSVSGNVPAGYLRISNGNTPFGAFELTGTQELSWTGTRPNNSALAAQFKMTNVIPAPGSAAIAFLGLGLTARRRR